MHTENVCCVRCEVGNWSFFYKGWERRDENAAEIFATLECKFLKQLLNMEKQTPRVCVMCIVQMDFHHNAKRRAYFVCFRKLRCFVYLFTDVKEAARSWSVPPLSVGISNHRWNLHQWPDPDTSWLTAHWLTCVELYLTFIEAMKALLRL